VIIAIDEGRKFPSMQIQVYSNVKDAEAITSQISHVQEIGLNSVFVPIEGRVLLNELLTRKKHAGNLLTTVSKVCV